MDSNFQYTDKRKSKISSFISNITRAPLISIPTFIIINFFLLDSVDFLKITTICIFFAAILPVTVLIITKKSGIDLSMRINRNYPFIIAITSYLIGTVILLLVNAPLITTILMFCYFSNTLIMFLINLHWKISVHAMGVSGPTTVLIFVFGYLGSILGLILPVVMWSRMYLKKHTISQVIMGAFLGFVLTAVQVSFIFYINKINFDVTPILFLTFAFMAPAILISIVELLNKKELQESYVKLILYFAGFMLISFFLIFAPLSAVVIFLTVSIIYILSEGFFGNIFHSLIDKRVIRRNQ